MKKILILAACLLMLTVTAHAQDARFYFNKGLASSFANTKIFYFTKALALDPNFAEVYQHRAIHYYFQERYERAINDYSQVIRLMPQQVEAYHMRGICYLKTGNLRAAIADLTRAIELQPGLASAYSYRAEAYRLAGMPEKAIKDSSKAIELRADEVTLADAYKTRAKAYGALGREHLSDEDFDRSFAVDPRYAIYRYLAGTTSLQGVRKMGIIWIIGIAFVLIFKLTIPKPKK